MNTLRLKFIESENLSSLDCKYLGFPNIPKQWVEEDLFDDDDIFICQLNLKELSEFNTPFSKQGILYFFINHITKNPKVLYSENLDLVEVDFNDTNIIKSTSEYRIKFEPQKEFYLDGTKITGTPLYNPTFNSKEEILLLQIDTLQDDNVYLSDEDALYQFIIKKCDLNKNDFSKVRLDIIEM